MEENDLNVPEKQNEGQLPYVLQSSIPPNDWRCLSQ
jgi:hypothetical protein